jgi:anti-anti-sigma regulatory factor
LCKVRRQGGGLRLVHVSRRFREMLALLRLESVLEILESEQAAVSSLARSMTA